MDAMKVRWASFGVAVMTSIVIGSGTAAADDRTATGGSVTDPPVGPADTAGPAGDRGGIDLETPQDDGNISRGGGFTMVVMALDWGGGISAGGGYTFAVNAVEGNLPGCPGDFNADGKATVQDVYDFLDAFMKGQPVADFNGVDGTTVQDVYDFFGTWQKGCE